jgi:YD repeat-containing protein
MKTFKLLIILTVCIMNINLWAQTDEARSENFNPIPSSPTVSELGKYGSFPIGYYTGTPNINIPIHTLKTGNYSLPISLSYHASGIRVDDIATWVGLGWSLNAGGIINVNIKGKTDFNRNNQLIPFTVDELKNKRLTSADNDQDYFLSLSYKNNSTQEAIVDAEPDIFNYNFCGYSGQFVLDKNYNNKVVFLGNSDGLKISCTLTTDILTGIGTVYRANFVAIDNSGRKYYFNTYELTTTEKRAYELEPSYTRPGTWKFVNTGEIFLKQTNVTGLYLDRIELENGDVINFEYRDEDVVTYSRIEGNIKSKTKSGDGEFYIYDPTPDYDNSRMFGIKTNHKVKRLKTIFDNRGNKVVFNEGLENGLIGQREDVLGTNYPLKNIDLYYNTKKIKTWKLIQNYFVSNTQLDEQNIPNYGVFNGNNHKRLKLTGFQTLGNDGNSVESEYNLSYYGDDNINYRLPPINSNYGIDHWGYCNTAVLSTHANNVNDGRKSFQKIDVTDQYRVIRYLSWWEGYYHNEFDHTLNYTMFKFLEGSNKSPNEEYAKSNSLKKIVYPTKGATEFYYEGHKNVKVADGYERINCGGLRIAKIIDSPINGMERTFTYDYGITVDKPEYTSADVLPTNAPSIVYAYLNNGVNNQLNLLNGEFVGYGKVTETNNYGKATYWYYTYCDQNLLDFNLSNFESIVLYIWCGVSGYEYRYSTEFTNFESTPTPLQGNNWNRFFGKGLIYRKEVFDTSNKIMSAENTDYKLIEGNKIYGNKAVRMPHLWTSSPGDPETTNVMLNSYYVQSGKFFINSQELVNYYYDEYGNQSTLSKITTFNYNEDYELLKEKTSIDSRNVETKTVYRYPFDFNYNYINATEELIALKHLNLQNMVNKPVEVINYTGGKVINGVYNKYRKETNNKIVLATSKKLETTIPLEEVSINSTTKFRPSYLNYNGQVYFISEDNHYNTSYFVDEYDIYGNLLQFHKEDDISTSYIWGYNNTYPTAKIDNAKYNECFYTSFEEDPGIYAWYPYTFDSNMSKTGNVSLKSEKVTSGENYFYLPMLSINNSTSKTYKYSVWVYSTAVSADLYCFHQDTDDSYLGTGWQAASKRTTTKNSWVLLEGEIVVPSNKKCIYLRVDNNGGGTVWFDELRLSPKDAQMSTYTYDPLIGMTSETDPNGKTTYYVYDTFGRLYQIKDQDDNILKQYEYNYAH